MEDNYAKAQAMYLAVWDKAKIVEARRLKGIDRLRSFSLLQRIVFYSRFDGVRDIIKDRELERSGLVALALGMVRTLKLIKRQHERNRDS